MVHSLPLYLFGIPFFVFVYAAIIAAEENFLREKFGSEYEAYCKKREPHLAELDADSAGRSRACDSTGGVSPSGSTERCSA